MGVQMIPNWFRTPAEVRAIQNQAYAAERMHLMQNIVAHQDAIDVSWSYSDRGKTFKCGPWRWHVYAKQGTHLRTVFKREEEQ